MCIVTWEEIHGFDSPNEYARFIDYIESQIRAGYVREICPNDNYGKGEIYGGRWFENMQTGEIWRLVPPDIPFRGLWEPVDVKSLPNVAEEDVLSSHNGKTDKE